MFSYISIIAVAALAIGTVGFVVLSTVVQDHFLIFATIVVAQAIVLCAAGTWVRGNDGKA